MQKKQLFIFPHAGGSDISYSAIERSLSSCFDISTLCYPGRGRRFASNLIADFDALVDDCMNLLLAKLNGSGYYFMGHSFGALIAFECAKIIQHKKMQQPSLIFLSGRGSPTDVSLSMNKHLLNDYQLTNYLKSIGGLPDELLKDNSFLSFYLPIIRNDLTLNSNYLYKNTPPIQIPLVLINGSTDPVVEQASISAWQLQTTAPCRFETLEGGHFFHLENPAFTNILCSYSEQYVDNDQLNGSGYSNLFYGVR